MCETKPSYLLTLLSSLSHPSFLHPTVLSFHGCITFSKSIYRHIKSLLLMCWHNVLFRLSALISRLPSLCSEDEANTLPCQVLNYFISVPIAASKVARCHGYLWSTSLFIKVILGWKAKLKEGEMKESGRILCETKLLAEFKLSDFSVFSIKGITKLCSPFLWDKTECLSIYQEKMLNLIMYSLFIEFYIAWTYFSGI